MNWTKSRSTVVDAAVAPGSVAAAPRHARGTIPRPYRSILVRAGLRGYDWCAGSFHSGLLAEVVDTTGVLAPSTVAFLRRLGKQVAAVTGDRRDTS